jgi:hypothetical protein
MRLQNLPIWNSFSVEQLCSSALTWNKNRSMDLFAGGTLLVIIVRLLPCITAVSMEHKACGMNVVHTQNHQLYLSI